MGGTESAHRSRVFKEYAEVLPSDVDVWDYPEYISFLKKEIENQKWKDVKYRRLYERKKTWKTEKGKVSEICAWEEIQKEIFQAVMEKYSYTPHTFEEESKGIIEKERNKNFSTETCDKFNHTLNEESGIIKEVQKKVCTLNTVDGLCIPVRRSNFQFDTISKNISKIISVNEENERIKSISAVTSAISTLAQQLNDKIVSLKMVYPENKDLCKLLRRTYADYKDIIEGNDIVDSKTSSGFQCLLNETKKNLTEPNTALSLFNQYFKKQVEDNLYLNNVDSGDDTQTPCYLDDIDYTGKPQCLRFLEEWFEDYSKEKERFETEIKDICVEGKTKELKLLNGIKYIIPCSQYCDEYKKILNKGKRCYGKYITECKKNVENHRIYGDQKLYQAEVDRIQRITKNKYNCSDADCIKDGNVKLDAFFNAKKLSTNKIYCCGCINNVNDIKEVFGTKHNESSYIDAILNKLKICAPIDDTLDGATNGKITTNSGKVTDICSINFGDSFLRGKENCYGVPCTGYYLKIKDWICNSAKNSSGEVLKSGWSDQNQSACLPPRTQRLCLGRLYSNNCTEKGIQNIDTNEKLLNELVIAAKYEGTQLHNKYISGDTNNRTFDEKMKRLCNATKYSFADLGDIVKGTSIWENNGTSSMEKNLRSIFVRIHKTFYYKNHIKYKDDGNDPKYLKLRESWWNTNRQHIWKALVCGAKYFDNTKSLSCIKEEEPPNIDYMPQFLRWIMEWSDEFCEDRSKRLKELGVKCNICKDVINGGSSCLNGKCHHNGCQEKCKDYETWIKEKYDLFKKQQKKFDNVIKKRDEKMYNYFVNDYKISSFLSDQLKEKCKNINKFDNNDAFMEVPHDCNCNTSLGSVDTNNKCINPKSPVFCNEINSRIKDDKLSSIKCLGMESDKDIKWKNNNTPHGDKAEGRFIKSYKHIPKGVDVSPRRQNLCIAKLSELLKDKNNWTEQELKQVLLADVVNESYNISKYLKSEPNPQYKVEANNALKYSFLDYKNIIEGTDLVENHIDNGINNMIKGIIGKNGDPTGERKVWWNKNEDCVRQAMLCGYHKGHTDSGHPSEQLLKDNDNTEQFLYWIQEWYEDFCKKRHQMNQSVEKVCKDNDKENANYECNNCIEECKKYKEFLAIKKSEWKNQQNYYEQHHKKQTHKSLQEYLKFKNSGLEGCKSSENKSNLDTIFTKIFGDNESFCGCEKYDTVYMSHSNQNNCRGLLRFDEKKWKDNKTKDGNDIHFTKLPDNMYVSARRQGLCIKGIDSIPIKQKEPNEKKEILRKHILELAAVEGYNIGKYYKEKKKTNNANSNKYSYSVKECNALKYSFYDFKNIVIGKDYLELREKITDVATATEEKFLIAFSKGEKPNSVELKNMTQNRTEFWDKNKKCFWNAMLCGYTKGIDELNLAAGCNPDDIPAEENTPQFLLWLTEWAEDFYEQRQKKIEEIKSDCDYCKINHDKNQPKYSQKCNPKAKCEECKRKCDEYKTWIKSWEQQWERFKKYYEEQKDKKNNEFNNYVTNNDLSQYVVKKLKDIGYSNITSFDEYDAFANYPSGFQKICSCDPMDTTSSGSTNDENNCDDNFKSEWTCDDTTGPTTTKNMCIRENSIIGNVDNDIETLFFNSFTQWLDEISYNLKENTNTLSQTCNRKTIGAINNAKCKECKKNCKCYEEWKQKIDDQWKKQQTYFDEEKKKPDSTMNDIELNEFLYAYCWTKDEKRTENECYPKDTNKTIIDEKIEETNTRNKNVCGICPEDHTNSKDLVAGDKCNNINNLGINGICNKKVYDDVQYNGHKKYWTNATIKSNIKNDKVYVPPRRQQLCISYLVKNNIDSEKKLKDLLIHSIKGEAQKLYEYYQNGTPVTGNGDKKSKDDNGLPIGFCKAVERSFADLGDFVKGTNLDYAGQSQDVKSKLDALFNGKNEKYRTNWWEQNKRELWKSVKCGINGGKDGLECPQNIDFDRRDQFLRWFEEWGEYVCKEHTKELKELLHHCSGCRSRCPNGSSNGSGCNKDNCEMACDKYKTWIQKRREQWNKLSDKYAEKKSQYKDDDEDEATIWAKNMIPSIYLKFFNTDTCSKTFFNKLFYKNFDYGDQQELCECDKKKHDMENADKTDVPAPDIIKSKPCEVNNNISTCHEKKFDRVVWTSRYTRPQKDGSRMFGVFAPPRRQKLCVGNIWQHATDKNTLLNELMLAAKTEAKYLKDYYDKQNGAQRSSKNNELCKALERSFYDLGDIVKGTDLRRGAIVTATDNKIHSIFKNGGNSGNTRNEEQIKEERKTWWGSNKSDIWKAMTCDQTCATPSPSENVPQFLRWYEEWYEDFCQQRKELLREITSKCPNKSNDAQCEQNDSECESACSKYSNWLTPKKFEWGAQKQNYQMKKVNEHMEEIQFQNVTKGKTTIEEYLKHKYNNNVECNKAKIDDIDQIVVKKDDDYKKHYEPLCSKCRMKKLIDKVNEKKNPKKKNPSTPSSIGENICENGYGVICKYVTNTGAIKVPFYPDEKHTQKNKDDSTMNCGGIPSNASDIKWVGQKDHYTWLPNLDKNIVVSPRRRKLCYNDLENSKSIKDLKNKLLTSAANDAYNLGIKYHDYKNHYGVKPCKALQYSFNDYKHLIQGVELLENANKGIDKKITDIVKTISNSPSNSGNTDEEKRKDWWNANKKCVWEIMKCGYEKGKEVANRINSNGNDVPDLTTEEGGGTGNECKIPDDTNNSDQFLSWLSEWYEDYCNIRTKLKSDVETTCNIEKDTFHCKTCIEKCDKYKDYMEKKRTQWDKQKEYYSTKRTNGKASGYTGKDAKEYLIDKFTYTVNCCGDVETNIDLFNTQPYYDVDSHCRCKNFVEENKYKEISGQSNCKGLKKEAEDTTKGAGIKWKHKGTTYGFTYLKELSENVFFSSRRQNICFQDIDNTHKKVNNKDQLRKQLMKVAATEGHNLGQYYKAKNGSSGNDKYSYDVSPCSAMKYSFLDLRDIILGTDNLEEDGQGTETNLKRIFQKDGDGNPGSNERKQWWESNKECVWDSMKCGYRKGRDEGTNSNISEQELKDCDKIPDDKDYPIGKNREEGTAYQFLRWFTEWSEDFCQHKEKEYGKLVKACSDDTCTNVVDKTKCESSCKTYKDFINKWKKQYDKQSEKYYKDRVNKKYDSNPSVKEDVDSSQQAYKYLNTVLTKICKSYDCNCMKDESKSTSSNQRHSGNGGIVIENYDTHIPASLDPVPSGYDKKCECANSKPAPEPIPTPHSGPDGGNIPGGGSGADTSPDPGKGGGKTPSIDPAGGSGGQPSPTSPSSSRTNQDSKEEKKYIPAPKHILNCVDEAAYYVGKEAQNALDDVKSKLNGSENHNVFKTQTTGGSTGSSCTIIDSINNGQIYNVDTNENPFEKNEEWDCDNDKLKVANQHICLPPRRKHMCLTPLENMDPTKTTTSDELFKKVLRTAANEGKHLKDKWDEMDKKQNTTASTRPKIKPHELCDAMKYSFADLGDIIRGRDKYKDSNGNNNKIEDNLKTVFENIQQTNDNLKKIYTYLHSFRSAWWDANRKYVWEAMTCSAPENFQLFKRLKGESSTRLTHVLNRCGNEQDPPYDDYIPQGFRWIKEWSENYCNIQKQHLDELKTGCGLCYGNDSACLKHQKGKSCSQCQKQCKSYIEMVEKWKTQWKEQQEYYNQLYFSRKLDKNNGENIKKFVDKMKEKCNPGPINAAIFVENSSNCTNISFKEQQPRPPSQSVSTSSSYAFELPPKGYDVLCGTTYRRSCEQLNTPVSGDSFVNSYKKENIIGEGATWKRIHGTSIYVPPRTKQLFLKPLERLLMKINTSYHINEKHFSKALQKSAFIEAKKLSEYYKERYKNEHNLLLDADGQTSMYKDKAITENTLSAMKRSYADYGDLIKGTTKYRHNGMISKINILTRTLGYVGSPEQTRVHFWNKHKSDLWHAMICGYNGANPNKLLDNEDVMCKLPDNDTEHEFVRWFTEWTEDFCVQYEKNIKILMEKCSFNTCDETDNNLMECHEICSKHKAWIGQKKEEYDNQKHRYSIEYKSVNGEKGNALEFLKNKCKQKCGCISGKANNNDIDKVFQEYPENFKEKCQCSPDPLNKCPDNNNNTICKSFERIHHCSRTIFDETLSQWGNALIKYNIGHNEGVLLPPRRKYLCIESFRGKTYKNKEEDVFKKDLLNAAYSQGRLLGNKYANDKNEALQAMKYSFADYGDIIKGTDMVDITTSTDIKMKLEKLLTDNQSSAQKSSSSSLPKDVSGWWDQNKQKVWNAMLCGYKDSGHSITKEDCNLPDDTTHQFLRWLVEWGRQACQEKIYNAKNVRNECDDYIHYKGTGNGQVKEKCKRATYKYEQWIKDKRNIWDELRKKYEKEKNKITNNYPPTTARRYVKKNCPECNCALEHLEENDQKNTESDDDSINKLINRAKMDLPDGGWGIYMGPLKPPNLPSLPEIYTLAPFIEAVVKNVSKSIKDTADTLEPTVVSVNESVTKSITNLNDEINALVQKANDPLDKIFDEFINFGKKLSEQGKQFFSTGQNIVNEIIDIFERVDPYAKNKARDWPPKSTPSFSEYINPNILVPSTIIGAGSLLAFFLLKKKPKTSAVDIFRVLDIPQNDYNIPDETSTNRYVPYRSQYKGKTYIYVERDGDSEDDKYMFTSDTTDVTSSESEYEEIDINDIYKPRSPKYKTLIEVVLKPTKSGDTSNSGDISTNKFTDEEWNELKQDFISQYLQNDNMDLHNENIIDDNMDMEPNTTQDSMEEKPFITSIQDRKLYSDDSEIIYNINWNIPNNISTNTATYNSLYSGIDLINDSLNSGNDIDIYDELLKRKENELFGTNYQKKTSINSVVKGTNSDPILNQLDLFDKWLDRHRDMCNEWNNKEEMLHKLKDEWNKENNQHILDISSIHNDMNDQTYNVINTHESNDITFVENLGSTNIPHNNIQTNNLHTNIYMDIHYNENNDIPSNDNLENSYNSS
ncbi:erythrocyte membrane protein 1, PfEMP1, putative [Plasmodium sp. gorilla clade G2]|uniref:erythrocyte membrane protein 1, PfEMP1, putative n=1 Tax=Plasmodium sp. gorilla clade G2 TaxID=880535 RepID=UPI000D2AAE26|nr:erythrocyte membrane protein 1, PfEMP1, putative [Plasmodium sp. gorilla clade G2]SOV20038.1 erythrocyte membrane protein 1, PfEMP1, putative [Plasmodium sp. gorilla clade G2]